MIDAGWSPFAIGIGANLADRSEQIALGMTLLEATDGVRDVRVSPLESTDPVLPPDEQTHHPRYLNAVAIGRTRLDARALMSRLLSIESTLGRRRDGGCRPRTLDLDLLLFGDLRLDEPGLQLPHPRFEGRAFVTDPLRRLLRETGTDPVWGAFRRYVAVVD